MLEVRVNGESRRFEDGASVASLLQMLDLKGGGLAVEVNREIIPRRLHAETKLVQGDQIEIVTFVGGG